MDRCTSIRSDCGATRQNDDVQIFDLIAGVCGILAFVVLCLQGLALLRRERRIVFTRDPARSLAMAKGACEKRSITYQELTGTAAGIEVEGRVYQLRSLCGCP